MKSRENSQKFMNHDGIDCLLIHNEIYVYKRGCQRFVRDFSGGAGMLLLGSFFSRSLAVKLSGWRLTKSS